VNRMLRAGNIFLALFLAFVLGYTHRENAEAISKYLRMLRQLAQEIRHSA